MVVEAEGGEGPDAPAEIENDPEDGDGAAFLGLGDVGGHDGALHDPEEGGADAEDGARGDDEGAVGVVVEVEERAGVEGVGPAAQKEGEARADPGEEGAGDEEGGGSCRGEEGDGGVGGDGGVDLA